MKFIYGFCLALACACSSSATLTSIKAEGTPIAKVLQMMDGILAKGREEKAAEQMQFAQFKQFCDDTAVEKAKAITEAEEAIEVLKADISKFEADAEHLTREIKEHNKDINAWNADVKAATKLREKQKADYDATHKDLSDSLDALERAIEVLQKQPKTVAQADSLMQLFAARRSTRFPLHVKQIIDGFLQQQTTADSLLDDGVQYVAGDPLAVTAPEADGYEFQSGGVIDMLNKLRDDFAAQIAKVSKEEMNQKHAFDMKVLDLNQDIDAAKKNLDKMTKTKAKKEQGKVDAETDKDTTSEALEADKTYLADLSANCEKKSADFDARQALRTEELEAVKKAIDIIDSQAVSGNAEKHLDGLLQSKSNSRATSFAQLRAKRDTDDGGEYDLRERLSQYLRSQAKQSHDRATHRALMQLADRANEDTFGKVKAMIEDMITKLLEEQNAEAEQKAWCDKEMGTNEQTRKDKTAEVETLKAEIDDTTASIASLADEVAELSKAVTELTTAMKEASALRKKEKAKNKETISDAKEAENAVAQALLVLREFYAKAGKATALVQHGQEPPEIFGDEPYRGMSGAGGGVIGMLEVIESDFAKLHAETKAEELAAQDEYDTFMIDSKRDKAVKERDIEMKSTKKVDLEQTLSEKKQDLTGTEKELVEAVAYYEKLKPECIDQGVSFEDRAASREQEIQSLKEALKILGGEDQ